MEEEFDGNPADRQVRFPKLVPAVVFGMRAAALAGLVITAGVTAAGLSGIFDSPDAIASWPTGSTCCSLTR